MVGTQLKKIDTNLIPIGEDCFRLVLIKPGESLSRDLERFGKDLRQYNFDGVYKQVLCPYWQRTNYGTVRCLATGYEEVFEDDCNAHSIIKQLFNVAYPYEVFVGGGAFYDECKICGINEEPLPPEPAGLY